MKKLAKILSLSLIVLTATLLFSCKKEDTKSSHVVEYRVSVTSGSLSSLVYTNSQGDPTTKSNVSGSTWSSGPITIPSSVQMVGFGANGASDNESAEMTLQIIVDGVVKKENKSTGTIMTSTSSYSF